MSPTRSDTHPDAQAVQLDLLRKAGVRGRATLALRLSQSMIAASRRAIRRRHPELSEPEVLLKWVELHYGAKLGAAVREDLRRRERTAPP